MDEDSPLAAESVVSHALGLVWAMQEWERDESADALASVVIYSPLVTRHPAGGVALRVLNQLAPSPETRQAALRRWHDLTAGDGTANPVWVIPSWLDRINDVRFVRGDLLTDVYEDQHDHFWGFRYVGLRSAGAHTVVVLDDFNLHVVKDLFLRSVEDLATVFGEHVEDGSLWGDFELQSSYDEVSEFVERTTRTLGEPFGDETAATWLLLKARIRALRKRRHPYQTHPEVSQRDREELLTAFLASPNRSEIVAQDGPGEAPPDDDSVRLIADTFLTYACDYGAGDPLRWSPIAVELFLSEWAARKVLWESADIPWVPTTLAAFVSWAGERRGLDPRWIDETCEAVDRYGGDFTVAVLDGTRRGPAADLLSQMLQDGVPIGDQAAMQAWIDRYNRAIDLDR